MLTISDRQLPDYEYYLNENYTDGSQIENKGQEQDHPLSITRNALAFDGLGDYIDTAVVLGEHDVAEIVLIPRRNGVFEGFFGSAIDSVTRLGVFQQNDKWTLGYKNKIDESTTPVVVGEMATILLAQNRLFKDGSLIQTSTFTAGSIPSQTAAIGAFHGSSAFSSKAEADYLRIRIATYTDVANCTGDLDADLAAGLCTLEADWRCRTRDVDTAIDVEKLIDDTGNHTIDNWYGPGAIVGVDLEATLTGGVESAYDAIVDGGTVDASGEVDSPTLHGANESVTYAVEFTRTADAPNGEAQFIFASNNGPETQGFVFTGGAGNRTVFATWQGVYQTILLPAADTIARMVLVEDAVSRKTRIYRSWDVALEYDAAVGDFPLGHSGGRLASLYRFSGTTILYPTKPDYLSISNTIYDKHAWSAEKAINWVNGGN